MLDKKEIIRNYKRTVQPVGILLIRNLDDGRVLLLAAKNLPAAVNSNRFQLKVGSHLNRELQADYDRLGAGRFAFEVVDTLKPGENPDDDVTADLATLEELWLEKLRPYAPDGYNRKPRRGGPGSRPPQASSE